MSTIIERGISWAEPNGQWRKENITVDIDDFPEAVHLDVTRRLMYASVQVEIRLTHLRKFWATPTDPEADDRYTRRIEALELLGERYLSVDETSSA